MDMATRIIGMEKGSSYRNSPISSAWKQFIELQILQPTVRQLVAGSWLRCSLRMNPRRLTALKVLSSEHLLAAQVAVFDLLSIARPMMEDLYRPVEGTSTALGLVNSAGFLLDLIGDEDIIEAAAKSGIQVGSLLSEGEMGTNAFGLAIAERLPASITGYEHFRRQFHTLQESAAPIFEQTGHIVGALGVITFASRFSAHTLGMVVGGARAIEFQRQADLLLAQQKSQLAEMNAVLASISEGILVWNADQVLMHINPTAARLLGLPPQGLLRQRLEDHIALPAFVQDALANRMALKDVEATIQVGDRSVRCVLSLNFVFNPKNDLDWVIALLREEREVIELVQHQVGAFTQLTLDDIAGESPKIRRVRRMARAAAPARASILILGEKGTGKTSLASAIHNESPRREGPFLVFACSSIPTELLIGELLGYDKDASQKRPGGRPSKFELAHLGTLFLQNVDALPLDAQAVVLNVLELGMVQRLGSDWPIPVDVRIIASSANPLENLIAQGDFLPDLFFRLSPFEITLPPLRERSRDIPLLVERILNRLSPSDGQPLHLTPGVLEMFLRYPWPGNTLELETILSRAAAQVDGNRKIHSIHLPDSIRRRTRWIHDHPSQVMLHSLVEMEEKAILQAADACQGNVTKMAEVLGIGRTTVWRKLKGLNISVDDFRLK